MPRGAVEVGDKVRVGGRIGRGLGPGVSANGVSVMVTGMSGTLAFKLVGAAEGKLA